MKPKLRKILIILNIAVIFICLLGIGNTVYQNMKSKKIYAETQELVLLPEALPDINTEQEPDNVQAISESAKEIIETNDFFADALLDMSFDELILKNADVIGWIIIPDTAISYPIVQGKDNKYYLRRTWTKEKNIAGCIFLDYQSDKEFNSFNSIIYGHKMRNGTMFGSLANYKNDGYLEEHPSIYIVKENRVLRYDIFAAYEASVKTKEAYQRIFDTDIDKENYITFCKESSTIHSDIVPTSKNNILTLSTCTGNGYTTRWVVQAVLSYEVSNTDNSN